jgi:biotin carboxyl carrier protein
MKFNVVIGGKGIAVGLNVVDGESHVTIEPGLAVNGFGVEVSPGVYSILLDGISHEVRVAPAADGSLIVQTGHHEFKAEIADPRAWSGRRHGHVEAEGRQQILAPMPGKVVRLLVKAGDEVKAGQGLLVVEAMKMQNEVRSPKTGKVERLLAKEGQPVTAGEILAWID